jgi:hypothetical protein
MPAKGTELVSVQAAGDTNGDGDPIPGEMRGVLKRCIVMPRASRENAERGIVSIEGYTIWAPAPITFPVLASDVIVVRGKELGVDGVVGDWRNKRGKFLGLLFQTTRYGVG